MRRELVFSVNVPNPAWFRIAWLSLGEIRRHGRPVQFAKKAWRMLQYGRWLKREARKGRFHYLPASTIIQKLKTAGFTAIEYRLSYADQAFIFRR